jgi:Holliday junction resolvase-like predicted endonuclease
MNPRQQGDLGEYSAIEWLSSRGYPVFVPIGHSPDVDLVAVIDDRAVRVQVKTSRRRIPVDRWDVMICTRGGNQSWNGLSKHFSRSRCDHLFVLVGDGRRWFIPSDVVDGGSGIALGGPKYAAYEVEPGRPFVVTSLHSAPPLAG